MSRLITHREMSSSYRSGALFLALLAPSVEHDTSKSSQKYLRIQRGVPVKSKQRRPITLKAANMAAAWITALHDKLLDVAEQTTTHNGPIDTDDLVRALPIALGELASKPSEQQTTRVSNHRRAA